MELRQRERRAQLETPCLLLLRNSDCREERILGRRRIRRIALERISPRKRCRKASVQRSPVLLASASASSIRARAA
jgi:hypothetical protein